MLASLTDWYSVLVATDVTTTDGKTMDQARGKNGAVTPTTSTIRRSRPWVTNVLWHRPIAIARANARAWLLVNTGTYGLLVIGFVVGLLFPELSQDRATALEDDGTGELVRSVFATPALFALLILAVNVFRLSLLTIIVPSVVVPFAGLACFGYWAVQTGVTLVPASAGGWVALIPHVLTVVIELQAYALCCLGVYVLGRSWVRPRSAGVTLHRQGYLAGLRQLAVLAVPALVLLVVGAVWEAYSLRYLVGPLARLLA